MLVILTETYSETAWNGIVLR